MTHAQIHIQSRCAAELEKAGIGGDTIEVYWDAYGHEIVAGIVTLVSEKRFSPARAVDQGVREFVKTHPGLPAEDPVEDAEPPAVEPTEPDEPFSDID